MTAFVSRSRLYILSGWRRCPRSRRRFGRLCKLGASSRSCSLVCRLVSCRHTPCLGSHDKLTGLAVAVQMTTDEEVQRNLLRLHGLNLMNNILREYEKDIHVITLVSLWARGSFEVDGPVKLTCSLRPPARNAGSRNSRPVETSNAEQDRVVQDRGERAEVSEPRGRQGQDAGERAAAELGRPPTGLPHSESASGEFSFEHFSFLPLVFD